LKHVIVTDEIHKKLKILAASQEKKLTEILDELLLKALKYGKK